MRGQTELLALGIAFVLLTGTVVAGVVLANSALTSAERPAIEQQTATTLSDRLISEAAPQTARENVLRDGLIATLDEDTLRSEYNLPDEADVKVSIDGETVVETGPIAEGTTVERIVLVEQRSTEELSPDFDNSRTVTLPRRAPNATLSIDPPAGTSVQRVYANDRVVLSNETGLRGSFDVSLSSLATTTLRFEVIGFLDDESVRIEYEPPETTKTTLEVTVDA